MTGHDRKGRFAPPSLRFVAACFTLTSSAHALIHDKCPLRVPSSIRANPIVIAHRGASFHLPEHTLQAYRLALELGADYIEPDLVATKDARLVALHTVDLSITTDVEKVFPNRKSFSIHRNETGFWAHDFLLSELKSLTVQQRIPEARSTDYDGLFTIPSLDEILELLHHWNTEYLPQLHVSQATNDATTSPSQSSILPRAGLYAELKDPETIMADSNQSLVDIFLDELSHSPHANIMWNDTECDELKFDQYLVPPLVLQCFTTSVLEELHNKWIHDYNNPLPPPLIRLLHVSECKTNDEEEMDRFWYQMGEARAFLSGIGVDKSCLIPLHNAEEIQTRAFEHDLVVHAWTERPEAKELARNTSFVSIQDELRYLFCDAKVGGVFSEDISSALVAAHAACDNIKVEEPTALPTANTNEEECDQSATRTDEEILLFGFAAGIMGVLVGSIFTFWISNSRFCSKRRGRRQLVIPQHDPHDLEMI